MKDLGSWHDSKPWDFHRLVTEKGSHSAGRAVLRHHMKHTVLSSPSWQKKRPPKFQA